MTEQELTNFMSFYDDNQTHLAMVTNVLPGTTLTVRAFDQKANKHVEFKSVANGTIEDLITTCVVGDLISYTDSYNKPVKYIERNFSHEQRLNAFKAAYNSVIARQM